jgi:hypothetical protein
MIVRKSQYWYEVGLVGTEVIVEGISFTKDFERWMKGL